MGKEAQEDKKIMQYTSPEKRQVVVPKVEVFFNTILTSAHSINSALLTEKHLSPKQVVVAAGSNSVLKAGDWVMINVEMFATTREAPKHDIGKDKILYAPPYEQIGSTKYLYLTDRHIKYKLEQ